MIQIGEYNTLEILRDTQPGLFLGDNEGNEVLLHCEIGSVLSQKNRTEIGIMKAQLCFTEIVIKSTDRGG